MPTETFFSTIAQVAGTLWAVLMALTTFIPGAIKKSGQDQRHDLDLVVLDVAAALVTISNCFLCSMFVAFGELLPEVRGLARTLAFALPILFFVALLAAFWTLANVYGWKNVNARRPRLSGTRIILVLAFLALCFSNVAGSSLLPKVNPEKAVIILIAIGSIVSILLATTWTLYEIGLDARRSANGTADGPPP